MLAQKRQGTIYKILSFCWHQPAYLGARQPLTLYSLVSSTFSKYVWKQKRAHANVDYCCSRSCSALRTLPSSSSTSTPPFQQPIRSPSSLFLLYSASTASLRRPPNGSKRKVRTHKRMPAPRREKGLPCAYMHSVQNTRHQGLQLN